MESASSKVLLACCLMLFYVIPSGESIQCFHCTQTAPPSYANLTTRLCSAFDYSDLYVKDCPYSTMCMKKTYEFELLRGKKILGTLRDCAPQRYKYQAYKEGAWRMESKIEEPYEVGCNRDPHNEGAMYCYCRGYLCNSATKKTAAQLDIAGYHTDAMAVIFVFNAMKYLRGDR